MGMRSDDPRPVVDCSDRPSRTKQSFKDECDINKIMAKYRRTGLVTHLARGVPRFADVSEVGSYREAVERVRAGEAHFRALPAAVREAFDNSAAAYVEWLSDPTNDETKLEALGIKLLDDDPDNDPDPLEDQPTPTPEGRPEADPAA